MEVSRRAAPQAGFTLIELMVVISIIAIMLAAGIPAINSLSKSGGRKAALGSLMGALEQARTEAIKSGRATYLVFPDTIPGADAATTDRYAYRSYALFQEDPENPTASKQLTNWKTLPTGISIRSGSLNYFSNAKQFAFAPTSSTAPFRFLQFTSTGEVDAASTPGASTGSIQLSIFEGSVLGGQDRATSANRNLNETITLARLTGRASQKP